MSFGGGNATGLGLLYHGGYAAVTDIYWCPSTAYPWIRFYTEVEQKERLADVSGTYGSQSSYIYRRRTGYKEMSGNEGQWSGTLDGKFGQFAHLITINDFSADLSAVTDMHMYPRDEVVPNRSLHKTGLNAAYWEGNVSWVNDPDPDYHTAWFVDGPRSSKPWNTFFWLADFPNQAENY